MNEIKFIDGGVCAANGFSAAGAFAGIGNNSEKGDMALIGPRPLLPEYLPYYTERERLRHTVRPGISGWAQVNGRNNVTWDQKLELDAYYVEHLSFLMDLRVLLTTVKNVLGGKDVNVVPSAVKGAGKLNVERSDRKLR